MENHVGVAPLALGQVTLNSRNLTGAWSSTWSASSGVNAEPATLAGPEAPVTARCQSYPETSG